MQTKIIIALSAFVLGLSGYLFYDSLNSGEMSKAEVQTEFNDLKTDYETMQKDLEETVKTQAISNSVIEMQQKKIETLMRKNAITEEELFEAKKIMREISQSVLDEYQRRVSILEKEKLGLVTDRKEDEILLKQLQSRVKNLEQTNKNISIKYNEEKNASVKKDNLLAYASKISISNFVLKGFKVRDSGREIETDKASRIDRLKVYFDINENKLAESGKKELYIVAKNQEGNLLTFAEKPTGNFVFEGKKLTYSDKTMVDYIKGQEKTIEIIWNSEDFKRGNYTLEVFEKSTAGIAMIGKATKTLE